MNNREGAPAKLRGAAKDSNERKAGWMESELATEWSERDARLIHLLSLGMTKTAAAQDVGITRESVSNFWNKNPEFRRAVRKQAMDRMERDERLLASTLTEAIAKLRLLIQSDDDNVSLKAVSIVISKCAAISDSELKNDIEELKLWRAETNSAHHAS